MFFFAVGAIAAPLVASGLIERYGPAAMFMMIAAAHAVLILFGIVRMRVRPTQDQKTSYVWLPRTSFTIGRLTRNDEEDPKK